MAGDEGERVNGVGFSGGGGGVGVVVLVVQGPVPCWLRPRIRIWR